MPGVLPAFRQGQDGEFCGLAAPSMISGAWLAAFGNATTPIGPTAGSLEHSC